jgi:hypothetical protein
MLGTNSAPLQPSVPGVSQKKTYRRAMDHEDGGAPVSPRSASARRRMIRSFELKESGSIGVSGRVID